jgi:hypothetical protein
MEKIKMRFVVLLIIAALILSLSACDDGVPENISGENDIMVNNGIENDSGATNGNELSYQGTFREPTSVGSLDSWPNLDFTMTSEAALEIGIAILRHTFGENIFDGLAPVVTENTEENTFVVTSTIDSDTEFSVTLDREDARILQVYNDGEVGVTITKELALEIGDAALRLAFGEGVFEDAVFFVVEYTNNNAFAVWRVPRAYTGRPGILGTSPLATVDNADGRIVTKLPYQGRFRGHVNWDLNLDSWPTHDFILTMEAALEIGDAILRHTFGEGTFDGITPVVTENTEENTFVVTSTIDSDTKFSVTLDREDARILQVYNDGEVGVTITQELALEIGDAALRLVFGEQAVEDTVFLVTEHVADNAFSATRTPRASGGVPGIEPNVPGSFPTAIIDGVNGRIVQVGHN